MKLIDNSLNIFFVEISGNAFTLAKMPVSLKHLVALARGEDIFISLQNILEEFL